MSQAYSVQAAQQNVEPAVVKSLVRDDAAQAGD
jgi:hypothetical protein